MTKKLTYADAMAEIEEIINKIENDEFTVDDLAEKVKRISFLIQYCKDKLRSTEEELDNIDLMDKNGW
jgi:exodeoxyribonuclease VII small subunit